MSPTEWTGKTVFPLASLKRVFLTMYLFISKSPVSAQFQQQEFDSAGMRYIYKHTYTGQPLLYWAGERDSYTGCMLHYLMCYTDLLIHWWCPAGAVHMCLCKQVCITQMNSWCITGVTASKERLTANTQKCSLKKMGCRITHNHTLLRYMYRIVYSLKQGPTKHKAEQLYLPLKEEGISSENIFKGGKDCHIKHPYFHSSLKKIIILPLCSYKLSIISNIFYV